MPASSIFNVYGFLGLDALIQFDPFHFIAEIGGDAGGALAARDAVRDPRSS